MQIAYVEFDDIGFRNLHNLKIEISPRITVIAGHNGIGKSTILGLIANGSELKSQKTLLDKSFRADFSEIFFLDYNGDYKHRLPNSSRAILTYRELGNEIKKECEVTGSQKVIINKKQFKPFMAAVDEKTLTEKQKAALDEQKIKNPNENFLYVYRMRVIPRTNTKLSETDDNYLEENNLAGAAKVELPTIYLGMSRISPIGEFDPAHVTLKSKNLDSEIVSYIYELFNSVIKFTSSSEALHSHSFGNNNKQSLVPTFNYSSLNISLGQDSLSSIVTAFASFYNLKRELGSEYKGGILIIDEVEAGFHPKAQLKLMEVIQKQARKLQLQVIVTSHSLTIMKFILDYNDKISESARLDSVIYLMDTKMPKVMNCPTYTAIKSDMLLTKHEFLDDKEFVKVYFEDDEAMYFFKKILSFKNIGDGENTFGAKLKPISLKIGCEILIKLAKSDSYFKTAVLIADNDVASQSSNRKVITEYKNFCILPASKQTNDNTPPKERTPEFYIYDFLLKKLHNMISNTSFWDSMGRYTTDYFEEHILNLNVSDLTDREIMKKWFNDNIAFFDRMNILEKWCEENIEQVDDFIDHLNRAVNEAYQNLEMAKEFE